jgi:hypothetical protein
VTLFFPVFAVCIQQMESTFNIHKNHLSTDPYFDANSESSVNVTVVKDETAYLVCVVRNLGNSTVSFLRVKDMNLLSVGKFKYTQDPRVQIFHNHKNGTWTLKVKNFITIQLGNDEKQATKFSFDHEIVSGFFSGAHRKI